MERLDFDLYQRNVGRAAAHVIHHDLLKKHLFIRAIDSPVAAGEKPINSGKQIGKKFSPDIIQRAGRRFIETHINITHPHAANHLTQHFPALLRKVGRVCHDKLIEANFMMAVRN